MAPSTPCGRGHHIARREAVGAGSSSRTCSTPPDGLLRPPLPGRRCGAGRHCPGVGRAHPAEHLDIVARPSRPDGSRPGTPLQTRHLAPELAPRSGNRQPPSPTKLQPDQAPETPPRARNHRPRTADRHQAPETPPRARNHRPRTADRHQAPETPPRARNTRSNVHLQEHSARWRRPHDRFRSKVANEPWENHRATTSDARNGRRPPSSLLPRHSLLPRRPGGISPAIRHAPGPPAVKSASYPVSRRLDEVTRTSHMRSRSCSSTCATPSSAFDAARRSAAATAAGTALPMA